MKKKSLIFAKAAILSSALMFILCSNAFGQCLSSFFKTNPDRYEIDVSHTVSSDCTIDHNVVVLSGCTLRFNGTSQDLTDITFTGSSGLSITVNSGGEIISTYTTFKPGQGVASWGGIRITGGTPSFTDCEFYDAEKTGNNSCLEDHAGGALWVIGGNITLTRCTISGCSTEDAGGAICLRNSSLGSFTDCVFSYNSTTNSVGGGAVALLNFSELTINNGVFFNNSSGTWGGAILARSSPSGTATSELEIYNSTFNGNIAIDGGAIANTRSMVKIDNTKFNENEATDSGGAIYSTTSATESGILNSSDCWIYIENSEFNSNNSDFNGGAIFIEAITSNHVAEIFKTTLNENESDEAGGAIYSVADAGGTSVISIEQNCEFQKNSSENGGAIANIRSDFLISQSLFNENTATNYGGAIYSTTGTTGTPSGVIAANSNTELSECVLTDNAATNGGAVYCESSIYDYTLLNPFHISSLTISSNTEFTGNTAVFKGGAISMLRSKADISETTFSGNSTTDEDGGCYGGAFYSSKNRGEIKFVECTFEENNSDIGGAIAIQSSIWDYPHENRPNNILIEESGFRLNSTTSNSGTMGGAVYIGDYPSSSTFPEIQSLDGLRVQNNEFDQNNSSNGGAICLTNFDGQGSIASSFLISWNIFSNNIASNTGGAMLLNDMNYGEIDFFLNKVTGNSSVSNGGGIYLSNVENFNCINNLIVNNTSTSGRGGGVYCNTSDFLSFGSNTIADNFANIDGGGIYFINSNANSPFPIVFNSILWENSPNSIFDANYINYWNYCEYSDIQGMGGQGQNNLDVDPEFADPSNGDYTLDCDNSPCVNEGNNSFFHTDYDLLFNDRIDNNPQVIDMGAYECPDANQAPQFRRHINQMTVFPNPFNGELSVQSPEPIVQIRLYSITGQLMLIERPVKTTHSIVCSDCPAGVYILHITTSSENHVKRVIKSDMR